MGPSEKLSTGWAHKEADMQIGPQPDEWSMGWKPGDGGAGPLPFSPALSFLLLFPLASALQPTPLPFPAQPLAFGQGRGPIFLDNVECRGQEASLSECGSRGWGVHNCFHYEDVAVLCDEFLHTQPLTRKVLTSVAPPTALQNGKGEGSLRLVGGAGPCQGRVEILHGGLWGTICDDDWGLPDAAVVCRQLGCGAALAATTNAFFGYGTGHILLDNVHCEGGELRLAACQSLGWGVHNCGHHEDAGVLCAVRAPPPSPPPPPPATKEDWAWHTEPAAEVLRIGVQPDPQGLSATAREHVPQYDSHLSFLFLFFFFFCPSSPGPEELGLQVQQDGSETTRMPSPRPRDGHLRLASGTHRCEGRVELFLGQRWGTVCDDAWDLRAAIVLCRQLGCGQALAAPGEAHFGPGRGPILLDNVKCRGDESTLLLCSHIRWDVHNCDHSEDASVLCQPL
ncbi:scavenger receptor cysteine-rich domain-containing group B protein isoform X1 [Cricetulus griseus]|uniref:scavenger receptor cysteine-rich domain-containing group B protein isoform X1 n=1 Tax=Cricetulus griseus TaxID=10029 RepID=UPI000F73FAFC|nr:scavenger receptor cysteine-rich domain-containing group B protein isoform X1 [Cricetulus griseus]